MADCICQVKAEFLERANKGRNPLRKPFGGWICPVHGQIDYADTVIINTPKIRRPPRDDRSIHYKPCPTCGIEREEDDLGHYFCPACGFHF